MAAHITSYHITSHHNISSSIVILPSIWSCDISLFTVFVLLHIESRHAVLSCMVILRIMWSYNITPFNHISRYSSLLSHYDESNNSAYESRILAHGARYCHFVIMLACARIILGSIIAKWQARYGRDHTMRRQQILKFILWISPSPYSHSNAYHHISYPDTHSNAYDMMTGFLPSPYVTAIHIVAVTTKRQNLSFFQERFWKRPLNTTSISRFSSW